MSRWVRFRLRDVSPTACDDDARVIWRYDDWTARVAYLDESCSLPSSVRQLRLLAQQINMLADEKERAPLEYRIEDLP
jgi:hypothetical protein